MSDDGFAAFADLEIKEVKKALERKTKEKDDLAILFLDKIESGEIPVNDELFSKLNLAGSGSGGILFRILLAKHAGNYELAIELCEILIKNGEGMPAILLDKANMLCDVKRFDEALECIELVNPIDAAREEPPENDDVADVEFYESKTKIMFGLKRYEEAEKCFLKMCETIERREKMIDLTNMDE